MGPQTEPRRPRGQICHRLLMHSLPAKDGFYRCPLATYLTMGNINSGPQLSQMLSPPQKNPTLSAADLYYKTLFSIIIITFRILPIYKECTFVFSCVTSAILPLGLKPCSIYSLPCPSMSQPCCWGPPDSSSLRNAHLAFLCV